MFGEKLTSARTEKNLTQEQLAEKLFVMRQAVSRWENNRTQPDLQTLGRICSILEVSPEFFIETDNKQEVSYDSLSYSQKLEYFHLFTVENMRLYVLTSLILSCTGLAFSGFTFVLTATIVDTIHGTFGVSPAIWIALCFGAILGVAALTFLSVYFSRMRSTVFNNWLSQRNVVRTKKFL